MKTLQLLGMTLFALSSTLAAQEVIILDGDLSAPQKGIRTTTGRDQQSQARANRAGINAQILVAENGRNLRAAAPGEVFFDGQRFRLHVASSEAGYLYVLCQNSQGNSTVLFPTLETNSRGGQLGSRSPITIPDRGWFEFDSDPGVEQVYILVSAGPLEDLDQAIGQGGELAPALLRRYSTGRPTQREASASKGLIFTGSDILVRKLELVHDRQN